MNRVKSFRALVGWSQKQMAQKLKLSETQYRAKENGRYDFTQSEMKSFFEAVKPFKEDLTYEDIFFTNKPTQTDLQEVI